MLRLTTDIWVAAYLRRLQLANIPAFVTAKGDATAGAVLVKLNRLDGTATLFQRSYDSDGARIWVAMKSDAEPVIDASLKKQRGFDPDIWIVEVEDRDGRHLLDEEGLQ